MRQSPNEAEEQRLMGKEGAHLDVKEEFEYLDSPRKEEEKRAPKRRKNSLSVMFGRRGALWQPEEVEILLGLILRSRDLELLMSSTYLPTTRAYERLARKMASEGYPRTSQQIRCKFKTIKNAFMTSLEQWGDEPRVRPRSPHHATMMRLWEAAGRPPWENRHHSVAMRLALRRRPEGRREAEQAEESEEEETGAGEQEDNSDGMEGTVSSTSPAITEDELRRVAVDLGPSTSAATRATLEAGVQAGDTADSTTATADSEWSVPEASALMREMAEIRVLLEQLSARMTSQEEQTAASIRSLRSDIQELSHRQDHLEMWFDQVSTDFDERLKALEAHFWGEGGGGSSAAA